MKRSVEEIVVCNPFAVSERDNSSIDPFKLDGICSINVWDQNLDSGLIMREYVIT